MDSTFLETIAQLLQRLPKEDEGATIATTSGGGTKQDSDGTSPSPKRLNQGSLWQTQACALYALFPFRSTREMVAIVADAMQGSDALYAKADALHGDINPSKILFRRLADGQPEGVLLDYDYYKPRHQLPEGQKPKTGN